MKFILLTMCRETHVLLIEVFREIRMKKKTRDNLQQTDEEYSSIVDHPYDSYERKESRDIIESICMWVCLRIYLYNK